MSQRNGMRKGFCTGDDTKSGLFPILHRRNAGDILEYLGEIILIGKTYLFGNVGDGGIAAAEQKQSVIDSDLFQILRNGAADLVFELLER